MAGDFSQGVGIINEDPGILFTWRVVELAEVDCHIDFAIEEAEIAVVVSDGDLGEDLAGGVGFHELICP